MLGALVLSAVPAVAAAAVITTPALSGVEGGGFTCTVVNASAARQTIRIQILPGSPGTDETELLPGDVVGLSTSSGQGSQAYCRVISRGRASALRVSFEARTAGFPRGAAIAVVQGE